MDPIDTWRTLPPRPVSPSTLHACLVHIYPTGVNMGNRYGLGDKPILVGRSDDCDIQLNDHSVSRRHARIEKNGDGFIAVDLQSTNGTFVNHVPGSQTRLKDGDYLQIGNSIFRFLAGGNVEAEYHEEIYRLTIIDALTGVPNKRFFEDFLDREMARTTRHHRPLALVMFDIDRFKAVNDEMGHLGGDYALRELGAMIKTEVRREDLFARYGGEEFVVVLIEVTYEGAMDLAERVRLMVERRVFEFDGKTFQFTISLGLAATTGAEGLTATDIVRRADERLFEAKNAGRNRVCG
jgi:diguanylate cyclase (GGDEF)-like protein